MTDATAKSRALLIANLDREQRREFERGEQFHVKVGDETYELRPDITERLGDGSRFCAIISGLPIYDQMLARKLYLEHDPGAFFRAANHFRTSGRQPGFGRVDQDFIWECFRVVLRREFSQRGMDPRLIEVRWMQVDRLRAYELGVIYAGRYEARRILAAEHFSYADNLASVIEAEAGYLADYISRLVDLEKTKGPGVMP